MCIMLDGEAAPSETSLIHIPITVVDGIGNGQCNLLIYTNTISTPRAIMIVPFPVETPPQSELIGLVDYKHLKQFVKKTKALKPIMRSYNFSASLSDDSFDGDDTPLRVHTVGNYSISIAYSVEDLERRIDWSVFVKPLDYATRVSTLTQPNLYYTTYKWVYVVATATNPIKDDGFGVVYRSPVNYFPTAHELTSEDYNHTTSYEVDLYYYSTSSDDKTPLGPLGTLPHIAPNVGSVISALKSNTPVTFDNYRNPPTMNKFKPHSLNRCSVYSLEGRGPNRNIYIAKS